MAKLSIFFLLLFHFSSFNCFIQKAILNHQQQRNNNSNNNKNLLEYAITWYYIEQHIMHTFMNKNKIQNKR